MKTKHVIAALVSSGVITALALGADPEPTLKTTTPIISKADGQLSEAGLFSLPADGKRTYGKFCNTNIQNPPVYFYIGLRSKDYIELAQGNCYEIKDSSVSEEITIFASTSIPSLTPAPLEITTN